MTSPNPYWPGLTTQVAFNVGPPSGVTPVWTDISSRVQDLQTSRGRQYELDQVQAGTMAATILDSDEAVNPANQGSPYAGNVLPYRRIITQCLWPPTNALAGGPNMLTLQDPGFEAATVGGLPAGDVNWNLSAIPAVTAAQAWQGTHSLSWPVVASAGMQGFRWKLYATPGQQYTFSCYVFLTSSSTVQLGVATDLNDPPGSFAVTGTGTSTTGAWTRITVTWTATQPRLNLWAYAPAPGTTGTVYVDGLQMEMGSSATTWSTVGPVLYPLFTGYVERWPSVWDFAGTYGKAEITCVDSLAVLSQQAIHGEVANQTLAYQPAYYWPLWESQGASSFAEASGNGGPPLGLVTSKYGPGAGVTAGQSSNITGDPGGACCTFVDDGTSGLTQTGTILGAGPVANRTSGIAPFPATLGQPWAVTISAWAQSSGSSLPGIVAVLTGTAPSGVIVPINLGVNPSGQPTVGYANAAGGATNAGVLATRNIFDGNWHHLVGVVTQDATNTKLFIYIDGTLNNSATFSTGTVGWINAQSSTIEVGGYFAPSIYEAVFNGQLAHIAMWSSALTAGQISTLNTAGGGFWGESSGQRITRLANIYYTLPSFADVGASTMGFSVCQNGQYALDAMNDVQISEQGFLFVDAGGTLRFKSRTSRFLATTSQWTFGEQETPYEADINYSLDPSQVYNDVEVTRDGGIVVHISDPTSIAGNFDRQLTQQISIAYDSETIDHANYLLWKFKTPVERLGGLNVNVAANPSVFPTVLGMELNQRITVKRRTPVFTMSHDFFLEKIDHSIAPNEWTVSVQASPVDRQQVWIIGDPVFGQLDVSAVVAF